MNLHKITQRKSIPIDIAAFMNFFVDIILNRIAPPCLYAAILKLGYCGLYSLKYFAYKYYQYQQLLGTYCMYYVPMNARDYTIYC